MAVAFDAVGPSSAGAGGLALASLTWSHTCGGSANAIIAAGGVDKSPDTGFSTTATYAGTAMTAGAIVHSNAGTAGFNRVFTLMSPTTGANNCVITLSSGTAGLVGGSVSMTGAGSFATQYSATSSGVTTPATATSAGSASGGLIAAFAVNGSPVTSATAPSTSRFIKNLAGVSAAGGNIGGATSPSTGSNVTTAWTVTADWWAVIGVEVLQAAAAAALPILVTAPPR